MDQPYPRRRPAFMDRLQPPDFKAVASRGAYVYGYLDESDGKLYYVGLAETADRPRHKGHNAPVPADRRLVVVLKSGLTREQAATQEKRYVARYGRLDKGTGPLHNGTAGGAGTRDIGPAARARKSEAAKARFSNPDERAKLSQSLRAAWSDPEVRAKICAARDAVVCTPESSANRSAAQKARRRSPEELAKLVESNRAKGNDPVIRAKISAAQKTRFSHPEARTKMRVAVASRGAEELGLSVDDYLAMSPNQRVRARKRKREAASLPTATPTAPAYRQRQQCPAG